MKFQNIRVRVYLIEIDPRTTTIVLKIWLITFKSSKQLTSYVRINKQHNKLNQLSEILIYTISSKDGIIP